MKRLFDNLRSLPLSVILLWSLIILGNISIIVPSMVVYGLSNWYMYFLFIFQGFASACIIIFSTDLRSVVKSKGKYPDNWWAYNSAEISLILILILRSAELFWFSKEYNEVLPDSSLLLFQFANIVMFICEWFVSHLKGSIKNPFKDLYEDLRPKYDKLLTQFYSVSNNLLDAQEKIESFSSTESELDGLESRLKRVSPLLNAIREKENNSVVISGKIYTVCDNTSCGRVSVSARATRTVNCPCGEQVKVKPTKTKA